MNMVYVMPAVSPNGNKKQSTGMNGKKHYWISVTATAAKTAATIASFRVQAGKTASMRHICCVTNMACTP